MRYFRGQFKEKGRFDIRYLGWREIGLAQEVQARVAQPTVIVLTRQPIFHFFKFRDSQPSYLFNFLNFLTDQILPHCYET
jgi:hypothetical protein